MRERATTGVVALGAALVALGLGGASARAEPCCADGGVLTPWRPGRDVAWLVGLATRATPVVGAYDDEADYRASPTGVRETQAEARLLASVRVVDRLQLGVQVPFVLIDRTAGGDNATDLGIADVAVGARWDLVWAGGPDGWPGVALELGVTAPTGIAPEEATRPLAVDATGLGTWQIGAGLALEHPLGEHRQWLLSVRGGFRWRAPRTSRDVEIGPGVAGDVSLGGVLALADVSLAGRVDLTCEGGERIAGVATERRLLTLGVVLAVPLSRAWRALASVTSPLPIDGLGRDRAFGVDLGLTIVVVGW